MSTTHGTITIAIGGVTSNGEILAAPKKVIVPGDTSYDDIVDVMNASAAVATELVPNGRIPSFSRLLFPLGNSIADMAPYAKINCQADLEHCKRMHARVCSANDLVIVAVFKDLL